MKETAAAKFERQHMDSPDLGTLVPRGSMADIGSEFHHHHHHHHHHLVPRGSRTMAVVRRAVAARGLQMIAKPLTVVPGFDVWPGLLDISAQRALVEAVLAGAEQAPFSNYRTAYGKPMSVAMTALGSLGWTSDARGYRYVDRHPETGRPWPDMPPALLDLWTVLGDPETPPDSCLVNLYRDGARMGLHQDRDEADPRFPVLSISLGDTAVFRIGGVNRKDPTRSLRLASGDVCRLLGPARLAFHGVDRILPGSSSLVPGGGRINLTLRRARTAAAAEQKLISEEDL